MVYRYGVKYYENCTQDATLSSPNKLVGCNGVPLQAGTTACVASRVYNGQITPNTTSRTDGLFVGWSFITSNKEDYVNTIRIDKTTTLLGVAFVGNVMEMYGAGSGAAFLFNGDGTESDSQNITVIGNTMIGGRMNMGYTDAGGEVRHDHLSVLRFNILYQENHKSGDFFAYEGETTSDVRVGNWGIRYGVAAQSNSVLQGESQPNGGTSYYPKSWMNDVRPAGCFAGTLETALNITFADDATGALGEGDGDYTPVITTDLAVIPAGMSPWPMDLMGRSIATNGSAVAGAIQLT